MIFSETMDDRKKPTENKPERPVPVSLSFVFDWLSYVILGQIIPK